MCGRFTLSSPAEVVAELFDLEEAPGITPRYNIAPTQSVPTVLAIAGRLGRGLHMLRWGLIPPWADDPSIGSRMINARAETLASKPSFRSPYRNRRCLVIADGFYEWQKLERRKQPHFVHLRDRRPFAFAGLWERWEGPEGGAIGSCTIITTDANELMSPLHNRMPVILRPRDYETWLDPDNHRAPILEPLLRPYPSEEMSTYPVSTRVNSPATDSPECIQKLP